MPAQALIAIDVVKSFGDRRVLDGITLTAHPGRRIGLVGENGVGKSTLLRLLAGVDVPDSGKISRPCGTGLLHQELPYQPEQTIGDVMADATADSRELLRRLDELLHQPSCEAHGVAGESPDSDAWLNAYSDVLARAEEVAAWDAERRAAEVLYGLGLCGIAWGRRLGQLSGGQRSRMALAALLVRRPAALLLDEPTNHLDDDALAYMEAQLRQMPGVVIVASHDRVFLDEVCTDIVDIDPARGGATRYGGAYTDYLHAKHAERARWEQAFSGQQDEMNALRHAIRSTARQVAHGRPPRDANKASYNAHGEKVQVSVASRVRNAKQRLEVLEREQIRKPPAIVHFHAPALSSAGAGDGACLTARDLYVPGRLRLGRLDLPAGGRLLVTGPNGSGKSTLLQVLAGALPYRGSVLRRRGLRIGMLAQDDVWPDLSRTPRQLYDAAITRSRCADAVPLMDLGLVAPRDLDRPIGALSTGQRRRLALALLICDPPELLLLDEPTNHLSLTLADELELALEMAPGAVLIASHDRSLRHRWSHEQVELDHA